MEELHSGGKARTPVLFTLSVAAGVLAILATFIRAGSWDLDFFFTSDTLYLPSLYRDLFLEGGHISEWSLNPAPNFFPDMGLFFLLNGLTGSFLVASYVYPVVQFTLIAVLFRAIGWESQLVKSDRWMVMSVVLLALVPLTGWWGRDFGYAFHMLINSFHGGAFVNGLLCMWLFLRVINGRGWRNWLFLGLAVAAGSVSDRLFWVMFPVPAVIACLVMALRSARRVRLVLAAVLIAGSTVVSYQVLMWLDRTLPMNIENPYAYLAFDRIVFSWHRFLDMLGTYLAGQPMVGAITALGLAVTALCAVQGARAFRNWLRTPVKQLAGPGDAAVITLWMAAMFFPLVLFIPVLNGSFDGLDSLRYNFAVFMLAPMMAGAVLGRWFARWDKWAVPAAVAVIGLPSLWACVSAGDADRRKLTGYKPTSVETLDRLAGQYHFHNGIGNYWDAKRTTMFSNKGLVVLPVGNEAVAYNHVNRMQMFMDRRFDFALVNDQELTREVLIRIFRQDTGFHALDGMEVMLLPEWRFDPGTLRPRE